ncbi:uncharacterized protein M421DRAFT_314203 [Didymella exigua CBS 183.55]|uniref:MYND-type domain-containing protein n=1 Tax=Didymella exigua CBS 183.55 TaxID=1150837 RepID=A0A6A5RUK6_9PLEO|nr:uncharacterized protein M421DRAFT_314203 [Didymella exigua CBS 183.55]KAF1931532.1 hypothetical protein M421DRAFT_314203 [Didymella exigua CBS 183.55]
MSLISCGTATDPPLCGAWPELGIFTYSGCHNMMYCSLECYENDRKLHELFCT